MMKIIRGGGLAGIGADDCVQAEGAAKYRHAARRRSTVRRFQGGGRVQRTAARRTTRLADSGVGRRVTPISRIRRGAAALTQSHPPPDPVRRPAEIQTAACHRDLSDNMARRVAAHCHRVRRDYAYDEACGHHQPESHAGSIARRHNTTNARGLPLPPADGSARSTMTAASGASASRRKQRRPKNGWRCRHVRGRGQMTGSGRQRRERLAPRQLGRVRSHSGRARTTLNAPGRSHRGDERSDGGPVDVVEKVQDHGVVLRTRSARLSEHVRG
jgi:hypothetical protein